MKYIALAIFMMIIATPVFAGKSKNIEACVEKAKELYGLTLEESEATYKGKVISMSIAAWSNAICEVKAGRVQDLTVSWKPFNKKELSGKQ